MRRYVIFCGQQYIYAHTLISASECIIVSQSAVWAGATLNFFSECSNCSTKGILGLLHTSLASQFHSILQRRSLSVSASGGRVWRLRTTLCEQLERNYWISHTQSTQFTAYATPTQRLRAGYTRLELLYAVRLSAVPRIHERQKLCGPGMAQTKA